jgi:hypothetical protein
MMGPAQASATAQATGSGGLYPLFMLRRSQAGNESQLIPLQSLGSSPDCGRCGLCTLLNLLNAIAKLYLNVRWGIIR